MQIRRLISALLTGLIALPMLASADEGMWLFTNPPKDKIEKKYHFEITQPWLDHLRLSSSRAPGGSSEFVSPDGLLMTNHHVAQSCIHDLSTNGKDYMKDGFYAPTREQEPKCPGIEFLVLTDITNVTQRIQSAVKPGMSSADAGKATRQAMASAEKDCSGNGFRCDVVTLYAGAMYHLYKYKKYDDVRLVFAPEFDMAFFGGDPDNFTFPRYDLDIAFFRMYENGKPAHTENYLKFAKQGVKEGDLVFVSGHPGGTSRLLTMTQLDYLRDVQYPWILKNYDRRAKLLLAFSAQSAEQAREAEHDVFGIQNALKAFKGYNTFFADKEGVDKKQADEKQMRAYVAANAERQKEFGDPWGQIDQAEHTLRDMFFDYNYVEMLAGFRGSLPNYARFIVRATHEKAKPNDQRLRGFTDSALPTVEQRLFSSTPAYKDLEKLVLADSLTDMQEQQPNDPVLVKALAGKSPKDRAAELIEGTKLDDAAFRKQLYEGGEAAVNASTDPLIVLMRTIETDALVFRKKYDDEVDPKLRDGGMKIAKVRFAIFGQSQPPDATFTLRLSYLRHRRGWKCHRSLPSARELPPARDWAPHCSVPEILRLSPPLLSHPLRSLTRLTGISCLARAQELMEGPGARVADFFSSRNAALLRPQHGPIKGYEENGKHVASNTTMDGAYKHAEEHGNKPPYQLPKSWMDAKGKFDGSTPLDVVSTCDIIGGNSGSPVVNTKGELVGIIFDGNIQSLPLNFLYDDVQARAVHVDSRAILESLHKIYHADGLYNEITGGSGFAETKKETKKK